MFFSYLSLFGLFLKEVISRDTGNECESRTDQRWDRSICDLAIDQGAGHEDRNDRHQQTTRALVSRVVSAGSAFLSEYEDRTEGQRILCQSDHCEVT